LTTRFAYWLIIAGILALSIIVRHADPAILARLRLLGFDTLQQAAPRAPNPSYPVRIIDIDEPSLERLGSWPWRRELLATLVEKLVEKGVRVVMFDMVFAEPGPQPLHGLPEHILASPEARAVLDKLAAIGTPDQQFAKAIRGRPVVLGVIGRSKPPDRPARIPASFAMIGAKASSYIPAFPGATLNLAALEDAATGIGAMNWFPEHDQILRRVPTVVRVSKQLYPSLVAEGLRVLSGAKSIEVRTAGGSVNTGIVAVRIGNTVIPTDADGQLWLSFSRRDPRRTISAADVILGKTERHELEGRVVLIGTSAPGLLDLRASPLDPVISGVEINAQAFEQLLERRFLVRPDYSTGMEIAITLAFSLVLAVLVYRSGALIAAVVGGTTVIISVAASWLAFRNGVLIDAVYPILTSTVSYLFGTGFLHYQTEHERNRNRQALLLISKEMEAAAQIQRSFLPADLRIHPRADTFKAAAVMKPAKFVGGDFYDCFMIDESRLGFAVGDVSGKGMPAALFMGVSRTVLRTLALEGGSAGEVLTRVNAILARDNTEAMFVTLFYAVLHLDTGIVEFCSAGHDDVHLLGSERALEPLQHMGPAIGLFDGIDYPTATRKLLPSDAMLLLTDGVTEAFSATGSLFGRERLATTLKNRVSNDPDAVIEAVTGEVAGFSAGVEQSDDITCLAVQFQGRQAST
jgi:adenylate cyclase